MAEIKPEEGYKIALERIEEVVRTGSVDLDLSNLSLTRIPENLVYVPQKNVNVIENEKPTLISASRHLRVLICHAREDTETAQELYNLLSTEGWMEVKLEKIMPVSSPKSNAAVEKSAQEADVAVICLSSYAFQLNSVPKEFGFILNVLEEKPEGSVFVIPLRINDCEIPLRLRSLQYEDYFPKDNQKWAYQRLLQSIKIRAQRLSILHSPKTSNRRSLRVFMCYVREDRNIVRDLHQKLISENWIDVWLDEYNLLPGQDWRNEIQSAMVRADILLVCMSKSSIRKEGYVQKELKLALDIADEKPKGTIFVIPLRLDDCQIPERFLAWNFLDYFPAENQKAAYDRVIKRMKAQAVEIIPNSFRKRNLNLSSLNLSYNQVSLLPDELFQITSLKSLDLSHNQFASLPREVQSLKGLQVLKLIGNPLEIPPEILEKQNEPSVILNYYFSRLKSAMNECKVLVVGQGSVGKTSLIKRVTIDLFYPTETKTEGIVINRWHPDEDTKISLNIWDFGGQEIMHATHQFFLTKRSLYLLVLDSRLTQEENRVEYWLKIIQSFGGESPVLIVGNKIDQHPLDIDRTGLQKKYPNIVGILETSAATGAGIEELKAAIAEQVNNLPHVRDLLPETWFTVKTKLEELGKQSNFITQEKYLDLCAENEVSDETSQRTLIGFLHDLGVVLHFQDDPRLEALGILNPQWVTNGVYKILNSHALFQNKGVLTVSMLDEILNLPEYPRGKRLFIVDMMKKFELCYDIEPDKTFLVPDLLPKDQPDLKFNGVPAFEYAYPVLPSSVITRFIVRMNQKIDDGFVWRTGVVLKIGENKALVKADIEDRKITIAIDGLEHTRRDALSAIRYQLDEIHNSIKGLNPEKMVPIPNAPNADPLEYETLLMLEREGQEEYLVRDGKRLVKVNVREILSGIESESQRRETGGNVTNIYIGGDVKGSTIISGDENEVSK